MRFSDMLAEAMEGMSQQEVARLSGIRQATVSRLVNRKATPSYQTMIALERVLPKLRELRMKDAA